MMVNGNVDYNIPVKYTNKAFGQYFVHYLGTVYFNCYFMFTVPKIILIK